MMSESKSQLPCGHPTYMQNKDGLHFCERYPDGTPVIEPESSKSVSDTRRLARQAAEKLAEDGRMFGMHQDVKLSTRIIESVLEGSDLYRVGVEAALKTVQ